VHVQLGFAIVGPYLALSAADILIVFASHVMITMALVADQCKFIAVSTK
jgi:hypothetical protein